jgi:hypothetical protein
MHRIGKLRLQNACAKCLKSLYLKTCVLDGPAHRFGEYRFSGERFGLFGDKPSTQVWLKALEMLGF